MENIIIREKSHPDTDIVYNINGIQNMAPANNSAREITLNVINPDLPSYKRAFEKVKAEITYGNSFLTNLTWKTKLQNQLNLEEIYNKSNSKYKLLFKNKFVVFSPECFVKISDNKISSFPMKGTIDASIPHAEKIILEDPKEKAEHNTIVDLIRNDLSIVAENVQVERFRYPELVKNNNKNLIQISSKIVGNLKSQYLNKIGSIIFSMLPAGSISGAPKKKTVEIIQEAELQPRGYYTGISGYYDGRSLDSFVLIRFIEKEKEEYFYRSGGGITFMSNLESEYQETLQKIYVPTD